MYWHLQASVPREISASESVTIEWHSGTSLRWSVPFEGLCCKTYCWQRSGRLLKPHRANERRLVPSATWDHPHGIHLGHSSCSGLHIRAAKNTPVRATKIPTSHYPRSWRLHVSDGSKRNEHLWVWWPHLVQREAREIMPTLVFVVFVLEWILKLMGWSSQCIKVKQFDLYFKGCDYSGARLNDSRE